MAIHISYGPDGISLGLRDESPVKLSPSASASQTHPRGCYVYGHFSTTGIPFYIGKGTGGRAWSTDRHPLWHRYVLNHLNGKYDVVILQDELSSEEAESIEGQWVCQEADNLVNWISFGRKTDFAALDRFHALRRANLELVAQGRQIEASDLKAAVALYQKAISAIEQYATIQTESGLLGQLLHEQRLEEGVRGELALLNRLTLCLCKMDQGVEAQRIARQYFATFRADEKLSGAEAIKKRVAKSAASAS